MRVSYKEVNFRRRCDGTLFLARTSEWAANTTGGEHRKLKDPPKGTNRADEPSHANVVSSFNPRST